MNATTIRRAALLLPLLASLASASATAHQAARPAKAAHAGAVEEGVTLLPNGWRIAPAGRHLGVGDLPMALLPTPDNRFLVITNNGYSKPSLTVVDTAAFQVKSVFPLEYAWLGMAWHPDGVRLYSTGRDVVNELVFWDGQFTATRSFALPPSRTSLGGGLAVSRDGKSLFVIRALEQQLLAVDLLTGNVSRTLDLSAEGYGLLLSPDGTRLFVSLWGGAKVLAFDTATLKPAGEVAVGEHPNAMVTSRDGKRLFVACANTNAVWVVSLDSLEAKEQISVSLFPKAPAGSTPNALAVSPDGRRLLVANADNNAVAVVDIAEAGESKVEGFVPTGWYPTAVGFSPDGSQAYVLSGKGLQPKANPGGPQPMSGRNDQYIAGLLTGALSVLPAPQGNELAALTKRVYSLTPYSEQTRLAPASAPRSSSAIPSKVGQPSPIKHVFYIIRENRTYDQILGDVKAGDGDPSLCLFGEEVTPNAHALSKQFVLFDNFYVDAEVSYDGHAFSTGAYATDVVEKIWPTNYGSRGGVYLSEGGGQMRNAYGNLAAPADGYIWDAATRAGLSVRSYGEFVQHGTDFRDKTSPMTATVPGLEGRVDPEFPPFDMEIPDAKRADIFLARFKEFERNGQLPRLVILRLPRDHTAGARAGSHTPRAMIADNDAALGRIFEAISHSRYWKQSAIFVLEDDAQNGPDHVDAHRSVFLMASPYAKRGAVDSTLYTTSSVLRTMELILGLPPMSQYDAAATPLYNAFTGKAVASGYKALPARVSLEDRNPPKGAGAEASARMDFSAPDRAPDLELNEIIWKTVRGENAVMPPPRRAAFVRAVEKDEK